MKVSSFNLEQDYSLLTGWATKRGLPTPPKGRLSDYGVIVSDDKKPLGCLFLYPFKGSEWCMLEFLITDPDTTKEQRENIKNMLIEKQISNAKEMGYKEIVCYISMPEVKNTLKKLGFVSNEEKTSIFLGRIE